MQHVRGDHPLHNGNADELVLLRAEVAMLREATKTFDGTSLAVQLAEARATVQMLEFNVRQLESELDGSATSLSTEQQQQQQQQQSCGIDSGATCQAALRAAEDSAVQLGARIELQQEKLDQKIAEAESLSRELDVLKADSIRANASRQELEATIKRFMNKSAKSNANLDISPMDASVNFDSNSSVPLDKADSHTENFSSAIAQQQQQQQQQQHAHPDPYGKGSELVGQKDLEVILTGGYTPCNCEELQQDLASARAEMELAVAEAAALEQVQALPSGEMGGEIVTEWEAIIEAAKAKSRMLWHTFEQLIEQALVQYGLDSGAAAAKRLAVVIALCTALLLFVSCCCFCNGSAI